MRRRLKGSLTIYSTLALILVVAAILAFFAGARYREQVRFSQMQTQLALESAFANYNKVLWEEYHLLGCNQMEMEEIMFETANARSGDGDMGMNLLLLEMDQMEFVEYTLLTDGKGAAFVQSASTYMEENILYETAVRIYSQYESVKEVRESSLLDMSNIGTALDELEAAKEAEEKTGTSTGTSKQTEEPVEEEAVSNPLEDVQSLQNTGVLDLVIKDLETVSKKEIDLSNVVSARQLREGTAPEISEGDWYDEILFQQYLLGYMSSYTNPLSDRSMDYEVEYLLAGKASDIENLKAVVTQLLLLRTVLNFLYLTTDTVKVEEANLLAIAIAGSSLNPTLIEVVKIGLLTAWAFGESILDVRALLCGKKIALIKSADNWTLDLAGISSISKEYIMAEESEWGISYMDYLGILLLLEKENEIAMHAMDLQEATIRDAYGNAEFCMDELVVYAQVKMQFNKEHWATGAFGYY